MRIKTTAPLYIAAASILILVTLRILAGLYLPRLVINLSASMPRGVYRIVPFTTPERGMLIAFNVPEATLHELGQRTWLKKDAPLIKPIAGLPGDSVCISDTDVQINGKAVGPVFAADFQGRPLPRLRGCFTVQVGYVFPLSTYAERSFDGRYLGPTLLNLTTGQAFAVWICQNPKGAGK